MYRVFFCPSSKTNIRQKSDDKDWSHNKKINVEMI